MLIDGKFVKEGKVIMIDFHTHTIFSDGELIPSELAQRAKNIGYEAIAITDHGDHSNIDFIIPRIVAVCEKITKGFGITAIAGIELTHVPPMFIKELAKEARKLGAKIIVVHGETISEPVCAGTNMMALSSDIDILAHPGLITVEEAKLAAKQSIFLEISGRRGHCLTNGIVATMARQYGASLLVNSDAHSPSDLITQEKYY
ncbi:MAG: histidinol phosphate phosphatase domain-containing protein, partial [Deltaproteobacteria bacterium]